MTEVRTSETINLAADYIQQHGWAQGKGWSSEPGEPTCIEGALEAVGGGVAKWQCPAWQAVADYIKGKPDVRFSELNGRPMVWVWNDAFGRDVSEVIETLRAAAAIEQAREDAALLSECGRS